MRGKNVCPGGTGARWRWPWSSGAVLWTGSAAQRLRDYDQETDGAIWVVTQNGAETKLDHNVGARPGLRVRLNGPGGNPTGVGAQVRLHFGELKGPVREILGSHGSSN